MNRLRYVLMCVASTAFFSSIYTAQPTQPAAQLPPMSNEEQALAQQLDSVFEELTKGMSENEKNQFFNELNTQMEAEIEKMSKMSDAELNKYIQDAENELKDLGPWPEQQPAAVQPIQPAAPVETKKAAEPVKEETKKPSRDMVPTIDEIVARINSFIQKANQVLTMPASFEKWGKKGKLRGWNPTMTWAVFKEKIDSLKKTLLTIKSLDPKTQKAKYLVDLAADEKLCNNINQFKTVLAKHEPGVQTPSFGSKKLSKPSKAAIVSVINDCLEALLALNMQVELEKIIAKYEPTAKKIKEAEEAAQKKALEVSKQRPSTPGAMKTTVRHGEEAGYYEFGVSGKPAGYPTYGPTPSSYTPEKKAESDTKDNKTKDDGAKPGDGKKPEEKKDDKKGPETKKEDALKEAESIKRLGASIEDFSTILQEGHENATELAHQRLNNDIVSPEIGKITKLSGNLLAITENLKQARKAANKCQSAITELTSDAEKNKGVTRLKSVWNDYKNEFFSLKNALTNKRMQIKSIPEKNDADKAVNTAKEKLKDAVDDLISTIGEVDIKVNSVSAAKKSRPRLKF